MKFTVTTEVDPASDTHCGSCPQIRSGKDHDHCRLFDDAVLVFEYDRGYQRTDKCVITGQRAELALLRASRPVPPVDPAYLGFRVGARPLADHVPSCEAGCKLFSDGWNHHRDCRYAAWMRGDDLAVETAMPAAHWQLPAVVIEKAKPELLDLRTVPVGTVCEALAPLTNVLGDDCTITGHFTVTEQDHGETDWPVRVETKDYPVSWVAALQPARVVKHACPRCDEGMREIELLTDVDWPGMGIVRKGERRTAAVIEPGKAWLDEQRWILFSAYRFVRADVPPPSEWCDGKGVG